ncbi:tannase/feruloyl esterase family alpha/beta hydrolase [Actinomadura rubrisoli]|uniref:Tannase/feruloyl esterase family alpha/beta hydrolase n=1 Tax=Actinomadura rubrisoli TaxID=2530368 RepID=A0A4R5B8C8_9ACTN|nr:tannase/feruloyl esterase family alpha/beta hydrolase [Actinomadura rubrisoli]TDD81675.1 tannase/feruloyl esterase family alpha/beta hydrolase [Actinomadura rubrisoli]
MRPLLRRATPTLALVTALLLAVALLPGPGATGAAKTGVLDGSRSAATAREPGACEKLLSAPVEQLKGAPTRVETAAVVAAKGDLPEYCRVTGYVAPHQIRFELRLPTGSWNGGYYQTGCGGLCGNVPIEGCGTALGRGFAVAAENTGHTADSQDALWAYGDKAAKAAFGYLSPHVVSVAGKALTKIYYGRAARHAVFEGCSNGGRQGIEVASRHPEDFDGVIARDPVLHAPQVGMFYIWVTKVNRRAGGGTILPAQKLPLIHKAVVAACGGADGVIADPFRCGWDPGRIQCKPGQGSATCLTAAQVDVVRKFYAGPSDSHGRALYPVDGKLRGLPVGALQRGSELEWANPALDLISAAPGKKAVAEIFAGGFYRYLLFAKDKGPTANYLDFDFDRDPGLLDNTYFGTGSRDLRAFHRAGGRLLLIQDLADQAVPPTSTTTYYDESVAANGGGRAADSWMRLFTVPGTPHCDLVSSAPGVIDALTAMTQWITRGQAPATLTAQQFDSAGHVTGRRTLTPYRSTHHR